MSQLGSLHVLGSLHTPLRADGLSHMAQRASASESTWVTCLPVLDYKRNPEEEEDSLNPFEEKESKAPPGSPGRESHPSVQSSPYSGVRWQHLLLLLPLLKAHSKKNFFFLLRLPDSSFYLPGARKVDSGPQQPEFFRIGSFTAIC